MNGVGSSDRDYGRMINSCAGAGAGAGAGAQDKSSINLMMLRFRPIAPKPATCPGGLSTSDNDDNKNNLKNNILPKGGRRKRKYVRVRKYTRRKPSNEEGSGGIKIMDTDSITLQLLPEKSDLDRPMKKDDHDRFRSSVRTSTVVKEGGFLLQDENNRGLATCWTGGKPAGDGTRISDRVLVVQSWVTVECVTGASCIDDNYGGRLGSTDMERAMNLERDTCPGFVSDGSNRVTWVNGAFKKMVATSGSGGSRENYYNDGLSPSPEVVVGLIIKQSLPSFYSAFTGHVKLQYGVGMEMYSRVVPCDLWRMDGGGFAWRLDVEAALTLGR